VTDLERFKLIQKWYEWFVDCTATFEGGWGDADSKARNVPIGAEIAYLLGSIAMNRQVDFVEGASPVLNILRDHQVAESDPIWQFIRIQKD
jgi:hypothetical protein